jgi:pimeloyl-ACP methyl ester carboxylesterase
LTACSSLSEKVDHVASQYNFQRLELPGKGFTHVAYFSAVAPTSRTLHIYLEGDGTPWLTTKTIAADPTPRNPLMLGLMSLDSTQAIYLGRPCYFGKSDESPCHYKLWTQDRYSEAIVASMAAALDNFVSDRFINSQNITTFRFFGHSGGGVLAMLLAEHFPATRAVVTLAGNLDISAWTDLHGYTPLTGLNPASRPPLPGNIIQLHYAGAQDVIVPPSIVRKGIARQGAVEFTIIDGANHICCWNTLWPQILDRLQPTTPSSEILQ